MAEGVIWVAGKSIGCPGICEPRPLSFRGRRLGQGRPTDRRKEYYGPPILRV